MVLRGSRVKYPQILSNDNLVVGRYYWCIHKNSGIETIEIVGEMYKNKYLGYGKIWATDSNNQALTVWDIYGPIPLPKKGDN